MGWLSKYFGSTDITVNETTGAIRTQDDSLSTIVETLIDDGRLKVDIPPDTSTSLPASELVCGTKTIIIPGTAEPLVDESTPCKGVLLMAPCTALMVPTNAAPIFVGNDTVQNIPIDQANTDGKFISMDDAGKLYVRGIAGNTVNYVIFK